MLTYVLKAHDKISKYKNYRLNGSFGHLFSKILDFGTPIYELAILVPLFCQILKLHSSLFSFEDVAHFSITLAFIYLKNHRHVR
jgi:hypothetical protein